MLSRRRPWSCSLALNPKPGETVANSFSTIPKRQKRGKHMDAVGWVHDAGHRARSVKGHQYVTAILLFRGHRIPFGVRLYVKKEACAQT